MTERLYFFSDALDATATVTACTPLGDGTFSVRLDRTLFHPQGGGQPSDTGTVGGVRLLRAINDGDTVRHITDGGLSPGPVSLQVDAAARRLHTRLHSAGHALAAAAVPFGWKICKSHHWPGEARLVLESPDAAPVPDAGALTAAVNALIAAGHQRCQSLTPEGRTVGFGLLPATLCGGTHVRDLTEIGPLHLTRLKQKQGHLTVFYDLTP